jgi:hypothetical protein
MVERLSRSKRTLTTLKLWRLRSKNRGELRPAWCAGEQCRTAIPKPFDETTLEEMDRVIDINVRGVFIATRRWSTWRAALASSDGGTWREGTAFGIAGKRKWLPFLTKLLWWLEPHGEWAALRRRRLLRPVPTS